MKIFGMPSLLLLILMNYVSVGCIAGNEKNQPHDEEIKTMVMSRYDGFAKSGGKACDE